MLVRVVMEVFNVKLSENVFAKAFPDSLKLLKSVIEVFFLKDFFVDIFAGIFLDILKVSNGKFSL